MKSLKLFWVHFHFSLCYRFCRCCWLSPHICPNLQACGLFVANAVLNVLNLVATIVSGGSVAGFAAVLQAGASTAGGFGATKTCADSRIHLRSCMAVVTVSNREFQGNHIYAFGGTNWDGCLICCREVGNCKAVVS